MKQKTLFRIIAITAIVTATFALTSCGSTKYRPHCDAYGQVADDAENV